MRPDDPRHGRNAGYVAHTSEGSRPCAPCRAGHAAYKKQRRTRLYLTGGPLRIDATGTRRRIQALSVLGYTLREMDETLAKAYGTTSHVLASPTVFRSTARQYASLYEAWCMTVPTGNDRIRARERGKALRKGWVPPLAWDDIDDPTEQPTIAAATGRHRNDVDQAIVTRALAGERMPHTTIAEKREITRRWIARDWPLAELARIQGWKPERYGHVRDQEAS